MASVVLLPTLCVCGLQYNPDRVLISAGFDAAAGDPLGGQTITPTGYAHLTHQLRQLAGGKVVLVLEGGYKCVMIVYD